MNKDLQPIPELTQLSEEEQRDFLSRHPKYKELEKLFGTMVISSISSVPKLPEEEKSPSGSLS